MVDILLNYMFTYILNSFISLSLSVHLSLSLPLYMYIYIYRYVYILFLLFMYVYEFMYSWVSLVAVRIRRLGRDVAQHNASVASAVLRLLRQDLGRLEADFLRL